jgi:3-phenylpropionate/trans-cinnamate dioxygenase ferredoxin reductase subunit
VVIGGGFIGSEIAAALASVGQRVTMIFPEAGIGGLLFPPHLAAFLNDYFQKKGVRVLAGELVTHLEQRGSQFAIQSGSGQEILADGVVAGIGLQPNIDLAKAAGLAVGDGIVVDEYLRTSQSDIYAAGDVANFYNPLLGRHLRVEHEDNANTQGKLAGTNMASDQPLPYHHLPFFYSDLFDLGYEAVGELNPKLDIFADWQQPYHKGVIYYLDQGRVRGVILWNVWGQVEAARQLIAQGATLEARDLKGKIT